jgi:ABC-2 type transport system ATP-binding protein
MPDTPLLEMSGVSKRFGDRQALADVDLVVRRGAVHGLLGPNGAGKTTLLRIALGLARADAGTVRLIGQPFASPDARLPDRAAGFVDAPSFYPYLSGRDNLTLLARLDGPSAASKVTSCLKDAGLADAADSASRGYSTGMRQRLGLAAALMRDPALLLLDEPTSSLDPAGARDVRSRIAALARDGAAVVLSSHDMVELEDLCSELTVLHEGRIVFHGTRDEFMARAGHDVYALETSDTARAMIVAHECTGVTISASPDASLEVEGDRASLDAFVIALGRNGVAVRSLARRTRSLESRFLELTR